MVRQIYLTDEGKEKLLNESDSEVGIDYSSGSDDIYEPLANKIENNDENIFF